MRREFAVLMTVNHRQIFKVIIDPHYQLKHAASVDDEMILELVKCLDGKTFIPDHESGGFQYFKADPLYLRESKFRLVWLLEKKGSYLGVVNAFRRS